MTSLQWAKAIACQIALNRMFGEYDPAGGKAGCSLASEWDGAHARCAVRFHVCCREHRAVWIYSQGRHNSMFGGYHSGTRFDHWEVFDAIAPTLRSPLIKVPGYLVEGYLGNMMPTEVDVVADSTKQHQKPRRTHEQRNRSIM